MKIVKAYPPNYEAIRKKFDIANRNILFTYGGTIYAPKAGPIPEHLMVHEQVHEKQQLAMGIEKWWNRYLADDNFRLDQEVEAYWKQYYYIKTTMNRSERRRLLIIIVKDLSGSIYGNLVSREEAEELITSSHGEIADAVVSKATEETHLGATPSERTN